MNYRKSMLSIGEAARAVNVTRRMILNYEQRGLITSDVKEGALGNRYYSVDSLTRIRTIRIYQNMGLSLDEIASYLNGTIEMEALIHRLENLRYEISLNIERLRVRANPSCTYQIERVTLPAQCVYRRTYVTKTVEEIKERLRVTLLEAIRAYGTDITRRMFFTERPLSAPQMVSYCIAVPEGSKGMYVERLEESPALRMTLHGGYDRLPMLWEQIAARARAEGIALTGVCRHTYLEGPPQHQEESKFITQVELPIRGQA